MGFGPPVNQVRLLLAAVEKNAGVCVFLAAFEPPLAWQASSVCAGGEAGWESA